MKQTHTERLNIVKSAKEWIKEINKSPFINASKLEKIKADTKGILSKELDTLLIGSTPTSSYTEELIRILTTFIARDGDAVVLNVNRAGDLIAAYGKALSSEEFTSMIKLTEKEKEWVETNTYMVKLNGDIVVDISNHSMFEVLMQDKEIIGAFLQDSMLTDTVAASLTEGVGYLRDLSFTTLILEDNVILDINVSKRFSKAVFESVDKNEIKVDALLLDRVEIATLKTLPSFLELVNVFKIRIKEIVAGED